MSRHTGVRGVPSSHRHPVGRPIWCSMPKLHRLAYVCPRDIHSRYVAALATNSVAT